MPPMSHATNVTHQTGYGEHVLMIARLDVLQPESRRGLLWLFHVVPGLPPAV